MKYFKHYGGHLGIVGTLLMTLEGRDFAIKSCGDIQTDTKVLPPPWVKEFQTLGPSALVNKFLINNMLIDREDNLIQIRKTKRNSKIKEFRNNSSKST